MIKKKRICDWYCNCIFSCKSCNGHPINLIDLVEQTGAKSSHSLDDRGSGLVAHWDFDEGTGDVFHDVSGNGNYGTISRANWTNGVYGTVLNFDG